MSEPTSIATGLAVKSGSLVSLLAIIMTDTNLLLILLVGSVIGVIVFLKEITCPDAPVKSKFKYVADFIITIFMVLSLTGTIFYFGIEFVNTYYNLGVWFWIFISVLISQHYKSISVFCTYIGAVIITPLLKEISNSLVDKIKGSSK